MRWSRVCVEAVTSVVPDEVITSASLEERLAPLYETLHIPRGQLEALTGIAERRFWPEGTGMAQASARAGRLALERASLDPAQLGAVIYGGVNKDELEPATACAVADGLGAPPDAVVHDVGNACLGVLEGMVDVANRIELRQIKAGLVVSAESSREIVGETIERLLRERSLDALRLNLATLTGGSAAGAVLLTDVSITSTGRRLLGGASLSAPEHHALCRWGPERGLLGSAPQITRTDGAALMTHGVALARRTFDRFLRRLEWRGEEIDRVLCHQVGGPHRRQVLQALDLPEEKDFATFPRFGNTGTAAIPLTATLCDGAGLLREGQRVGLLGIGSGLSCLMLGVSW